ncbi:MAG: thiazole synthase [Desulfovibrionaceae bacterium]|nr:thiazole synthase [Desulfovibrionaceae bacterium]
MNDFFEIGGVQLKSRLFVGTGKYRSDDLIPAVCAASGSEVITVAMRRVDGSGRGIMGHIPSGMHLLPNTSGARTAEEAVRLARIAKAAGCGNWIKIEVISDSRRLLPDGYATARATEILAGEGFVVFPYINADLYVARACADAGAACVMPLAAPIGTNRGLRCREMIGVLIDEMKVPVVVDAGLGRPSEACEAMEMGADACLVNTGIASSGDAPAMARAFALAVEAGRAAWLAGPGAARSHDEGAAASSPLTGFLR